MAQEERLALAIFGSEQLDKLDGVVAIALQCERRRQRLRIIQRKGLAGAALIPLDDGKEILPWALERPGHRHFDRARSAVNEEEDRIGAIRPTHAHRLPRPAQLRDEAFLDSVDRKRTRLNSSH